MKKSHQWKLEGRPEQVFGRKVKKGRKQHDDDDVDDEEGEDDRRKPVEPIDEEPSGDSDPEFAYRRGTVVLLTGTIKAFKGYGQPATILTRPLENGWMDVRQLLGGERSSARQTEMEVFHAFHVLHVTCIA